MLKVKIKDFKINTGDKEEIKAMIPFTIEPNKLPATLTVEVSMLPTPLFKKFTALLIIWFQFIL